MGLNDYKVQFSTGTVDYNNHTEPHLDFSAMSDRGELVSIHFISKRLPNIKIYPVKGMKIVFRKINANEVTDGCYAMPWDGYAIGYILNGVKNINFINAVTGEIEMVDKTLAKERYGLV